MPIARIPFIAAAALALAVAGCAAQPKSLNTGTDITDGAALADAPAAAPESAPEPAASGEAPVSDCSLVRVAFAFDSAQLDAAAMASLREDAKCIAAKPTTALLIEGHCDERGTAQYNVALGARRAEAVRRYLADLGVKAALDTVSFGKELPLAKGTSEAAWAKNRRAELRVAGERRSDGTTVAER
jgi:peptidoglycan-associated lipoprotein